MSRWKRQAVSGSASNSPRLSSLTTTALSRASRSTSTITIPFTTTTTVRLSYSTTTTHTPVNSTVILIPANSTTSQVLPSTTSDVLSTSTISPVSMTTPATVTQFATVTALPASSDSDGAISKSSLVGGFLGGLMVLAVIGLAGFFCLYKRRKSRARKDSLSPPNSSSEQSESGALPIQSRMSAQINPNRLSAQMGPPRPERPSRYEMRTVYDARAVSLGSPGNATRPRSQDDLQRALQIASQNNLPPKRSPLRNSYTRPGGSPTLLSIPETGRNTRNGEV